MFRVAQEKPRQVAEPGSHPDQLVGIQSEAKIKMAATDTENRVVTKANSMLNSFY
jgi:hypothetical protein